MNIGSRGNTKCGAANLHVGGVCASRREPGRAKRLTFPQGGLGSSRERSVFRNKMLCEERAVVEKKAAANAPPPEEPAMRSTSVRSADRRIPAAE